MGNFVGGQQAVHQSYKPWLAIESGDLNDPGAPGQDAGEFDIAARYTGPIVVSGLAFTPDIIFLASYRPRRHNGHTDTNFGRRGGGMTFGVANALQQFTGSSRMQQGFDFHMGIKRWREDVCFNVISVTSFPPTVGEDILTMELTSLDANGFTLNVTTNLYDEVDNVFWMAMKGDFQVGVMDAGDTSIGGFSGQTPTGAIFLSTRSEQTITYDLALWDSGTPYVIGDQVEWLGAYWQATSNHTDSEPPSADWLQLSPPAPNGHEINNWDHVQGVAGSNNVQACVWGGARSTSWNWTTEYWTDDAAIVLGNAANGSFFVGASILAKGAVTSWNAGGIDLDWEIFNGTPYRIGYVLSGNPAEAGVIETNWETRPGGTQNDPPGSGYMFEPTTVKPYTVFMTATNYTFDGSDTDAFDMPRSPGEFWSGGGGGMGWHVYPFSSAAGDAWGVHTYANGRAELGHYANSATRKTRGCIMDGAGANSQPPAAHQHCVNIIPTPRQPGLNWRYADRHLTSARLLHDE